MKRLIIIPAYNEEKCIEQTVQDLKKAPEFDYIIINDCSTDETRAICEREGYPVINLPINLGIGGAVQTGYKYAWKNGYDCAVQVDGDGQHDVDSLRAMVKALEEEQVNMVIGSRFIEKMGFQSSGIRRIGIRFFTLWIKLLTGTRITDATSGLRMIDRNLIELFAEEYPQDYPEPESTVAALRRGYRVKEVPVVMHERVGGKSSISPLKSVYYMVKVPIAMLIERMRKKELI